MKTWLLKKIRKRFTILERVGLYGFKVLDHKEESVRVLEFTSILQHVTGTSWEKWEDRLHEKKRKREYYSELRKFKKREQSNTPSQYPCANY
jgi:hypothetical protein